MLKDCAKDIGIDVDLFSPNALRATMATSENQIGEECNATNYSVDAAFIDDLAVSLRQATATNNLPSGSYRKKQS